MAKEYTVTNAQKVILQNIATAIGQLNQSMSLILSDIALEHGFSEEELPKVQFNLEKIDKGVIIAQEAGQEAQPQGRERKNKK